MEKIRTPTCIVARIRGLHPQHTLRSGRAADDLVEGWEGVTSIILAICVVIAIWVKIISRGSSRFCGRMMRDCSDEGWRKTKEIEREADWFTN